MIEIIGHRGAAGYEPENTKSSFEKALQLKVTCVEFDVHAVRKHWFSPRRNQLVVIHDNTLDRTTDGRGLVGKKTLGALKKLDAGNGQEILTDEEVLDIVNKKARVNIEAKGKRTARLISQTINKYIDRGWSSDDFFVSS